MALNSNAIQQISIHASAKEATYYRPAAESAGENFNPRLREGGDEFMTERSAKHKDFNPRLREGGDIL